MKRSLWGLVLLLTITAYADGNLLKLRNTYYYTVYEDDYAHAHDSSLLLVDGSVLEYVNQLFKAVLDIEGSGKLLDGRTVNYAAVVNHEIRYGVTVHEYGRGVGNCPLFPFRNAAVDPKIVPLGSRIYIAETAGMELPDGSRHDGYWLAVDIGGAIKKDRIDLYIGHKQFSSALTAQGIGHLQALTVTVMDDPYDQCVDGVPQ